MAPDGAPGRKPYALFQKALVDEEPCCIATVVMHGKEQLVLLRPVDDLICMTILSYATEVKQPSEFGDEVHNGVDFTPEELKLTKTLIAKPPRLDRVSLSTTRRTRFCCFATQPPKW